MAQYGARAPARGCSARSRASRCCPTAIGAKSSDVVRLMLRRAALVTACGVAAGLVAALGLTRLLESMLYGVRTHDPLTFGVVAVLLAIVALLACYLPARRAARVDAVVALRSE